MDDCLGTTVDDLLVAFRGPKEIRLITFYPLLVFPDEAPALTLPSVDLLDQTCVCM
jgi:hypothetical protein